jgi:hypothetical protein
MIANSAFFPLPGETFVEETNVNFLRTFVAECVVLLPNVRFLFVVRELLGLVKYELDFFRNFMSAENTQNVLGSLEKCEGDRELVLRNILSSGRNVELNFLQLFPAVGFASFRSKRFTFVIRNLRSSSIPLELCVIL